MPAAIYLAMGPSGAGKDTLLLRARQSLAFTQDTTVAFVARDITRSAESVTDIERSVTAEEFDAASAAGSYALEWAAHGTRYAIPAEALERGIELGQRLVLNVSRTVVDSVLHTYGPAGRGLEVYCLNITASVEALRARLLARGREPPEEVDSRIARAKALEPSGEHVLNIVNEGTIAEGVGGVLRALRFGRRALAVGEASAGGAGALGLHGADESAHLAKLSAVGHATYALPRQLVLEPATPPRHETDLGAFRAAHGPPISRQLVNRARVCASCGKQNAVSMEACNGCGAPLAGCAEADAPNVVMGFVYGVARVAAGSPPLALSLRYQDERTLVYDDPLARSTCHLNSVPSDVHLRDWRCLLLRPAAGLELLRRLRAAADAALEGSYWADDGWRRSVLRPGSVSSARELQGHAILALNAVPSQFQLHMHYIVPPLLPADYHAALRGGRFTRGRWLPVEYVEACLHALSAGGGLERATELDTAEAMRAIEARGGPSYDAALDAALERYAASHRHLANWRADCFERHVAVRGDAAEVAELVAGADGALRPADGEAAEGASALVSADKKMLTSYGRPHADGKPNPRGYYAHARAAGEVTAEEEWVGAA